MQVNINFCTLYIPGGLFSFIDLFLAFLQIKRQSVRECSQNVIWIHKEEKQHLRNETDEERERAFTKIWESMLQIRESQSEEQRANVNKET